VADETAPSNIVDLCLAETAGRDATLMRLEAVAGGAPTSAQIIDALRIVDADGLSDEQAEKLAGALQVVLVGVDAAGRLPERLAPGLGFPDRFWQAQVHRQVAFECVATEFRAFIRTLQRPAMVTPIVQPAGGRKVSAIVVSYRTGPVLLDCLAALEGDPEINEIILVDNGNPPETLAEIAALKAASRKLQVTGGGENRGFAAGVNLGARLATGDRLLVLNPDAILQVGAVAALEAARGIGAEPMVVGGRIYGPDGIEQRGGRRRRLTLGTAAGTFLGLSRLARLHPAIRNINRHKEPPPSGPVSMGSVSGALMYMSRAGFDRLGGFDEGYFLHVEDLDLCRRAEAEGGSVIYTPLASALHHGATSDTPLLVIERHKAAGLARYFGKFARTPAERVLAAVLGPTITIVLAARAHLRR
ncbi:MAG: glycosyltransferase family 2 protein, partial [Alphaproteobacteria bacterium]